MELIIYQVDAFTDKVFGGNPAAIVPLEEWLPDAVLQDIAIENNLSETAYFVRTGDHYHLRWFTPALEVELCGHATLASAFVLFELMGYSGEEIRFETLSGPLFVSREGEYLVMDFPAAEMKRADIPAELTAALGEQPMELFESSSKYMAVYAQPGSVHDLAPDFRRLKAIGKNVIITSRGTDRDFISRFFAPASGVDEDPVTGSAHTLLTPYWAGVLNKKELSARQVSRRGGELICSMDGGRVKIKGRARLYLSGRIEI